MIYEGYLKVSPALISIKLQKNNVDFVKNEIQPSELIAATCHILELDYGGCNAELINCICSFSLDLKRDSNEQRKSLGWTWGRRSTFLTHLNIDSKSNKSPENEHEEEKEVVTY